MPSCVPWRSAAFPVSRTPSRRVGGAGWPAAGGARAAGRRPGRGGGGPGAEEAWGGGAGSVAGGCGRRGGASGGGVTGEKHERALGHGGPPSRLDAAPAPLFTERSTDRQRFIPPENSTR